MYDAPEINSILEKIRPLLLRTKTQGNFNKILMNNFDVYQLKCKTIREDDLTKEEYCVSGLFDPFTDDVFVVFGVPKKSYTPINLIYKESWDTFKFMFSQTLQHELIHKYQSIARDDNIDEGADSDIDHRTKDLSVEECREYLSDFDEIDAYSHDIAMEICYYYWNRNPYEVLRHIDKTRKLWSYNYYKKTFSKKDWTRIKSKLLKKVYQWMPHVKVY